RYDVLRTAVLWEQLPQALQVVYRKATLPVEEVSLAADRELMEQVLEWIKPERQRLELRRAPLMRLRIAADPHGEQWCVLLQIHHLTCDHVTLGVVISEVVCCLQGRSRELRESMLYRNHVAQVLAYARTHDAESFFRGKLAGIDEPTAPFGLLDVHDRGARVEEAHEELEADLAQRIRGQARRLGVSAATLFHAAWALVVARTSGREDVVFGSVLLGRLQGSAGAQQVLGMFINTLPLRLNLQGVSSQELVEQTQRELIELLGHEQASLAMAQRCSAIPGSAPLFTALLNYRHSVPDPQDGWDSAPGIRVLAMQERSNYPIALSVDDLGEGFALTAQTDRRIDPQRLTGYLHTAVRSLVEALERQPQRAALSLSVLPEAERQQVLELFNATEVAYPQDRLLHELFERQVERTPDAPAVVCEGQSLSYRELNRRANRLARHLRSRGVGPDQRVGICVERSLEMVVGLLGILKAGGAYVPLDPSYPAERLAYMLSDSSPRVLLIQERLRQRLANAQPAEPIGQLAKPMGQPAEPMGQPAKPMGQPAKPMGQPEVVALDRDWEAIEACSAENLEASTLGLRADHLAYVIYTSGSTGQPKGVMVEHRNVVNLVHW